MATTVKITRIGSAVVDTIPIEQFLNAVKTANIVDKIITINDIQYNYASAEIQSSATTAEIIKVGSITAADLNAAVGVNNVMKLFSGAKPAGKVVNNFYSKIKTPLAGGPAPTFNSVLPGINFFNALNPCPNVAGFTQPYFLVGGSVSPTNSSLQGDIRGQVNTVANIPAGDPYTAGEVEFYLEVRDFPILP